MNRDEYIEELLQKIEEKEKALEMQEAVILELITRLNYERERIVRRHGLTLLEVVR
jgi:hypothetical protein